MNITQGPMLENFARIIDTKPSEVVEWVNQYVNHPELATNPEPTEKERFESIKAYMTSFRNIGKSGIRANKAERV